MSWIQRVLLLALLLPLFAVWLYALLHAATSELNTRSERGLWVLFIAIFNILGALAYLLAMRTKREYHLSESKKVTDKEEQAADEQKDTNLTR